MAEEMIAGSIYQPRTSIIILAFNGMSHLPECLESIKKQTEQNLEIIVVDNASSDNSAEWVAENYPDVKLIRADKNLGFCKGMNLGSAHASGKYLLLLNQDVVLDCDCVSQLADELDTRSETWIGAFPKVQFYYAPLFINAFGVRWYENCHWRDTRVGLPDLGQFKEPEQVFGSIFPAVMIRNSKFHEIGRFDPVFWSYNEDFDLCYRAAIFGYKFVAVPAANMKHKYRASAKDSVNPLWSKYWFIRNYFLVFLLNYEWKNLWKYKRIIFFRYMGHSLIAAIRAGRKREVVMFAKVILSILWNSPRILKRRLAIQHHRKISDQEIWSYGSIEEYNLYHYNGAVVLSMNALKAATEGETFEYSVDGQKFET